MTKRPRRPTSAALEAAIRATGGNLTKAAVALGCSRMTLYTWIYQLDLTRLAGVTPRPTTADLVEEKRETTLNSEPSDGERITVTVKIRDRLWKAIRIAAIERETTAGALVEEALEASAFAGPNARFTLSGRGGG